MLKSEIVGQFCAWDKFGYCDSHMFQLFKN